MLLSQLWAFSTAVHTESPGCPAPTPLWSPLTWAVPHVSPQPRRKRWLCPCSLAELLLRKHSKFPSSLGEGLSQLWFALAAHLSLPLQVCGGFRAEMCTPARCEGLLCPPNNSSACGAGRPCRGVVPLSGGALATAGEAAREFRSLSARLRETAQLVSAACPLPRPAVPSWGTAVGRSSCDTMPSLQLGLRLGLLDSFRNSGIFE